MLPPFETLIRTSAFSFSVVDNRNGTFMKRSVGVHSNAITATCSYMKNLIEGDMLEARQKRADFRDLLYPDFIRFCEYAYRGDYTVPEAEKRQPRSESTSLALVRKSGEDLRMPQTLPECISRAYRASAFMSNICFSKDDLREQFRRRKFSGGDVSLEDTLSRCRITKNTKADEDFTSVFFAHARLYSFAQMHMIEPLEALILTKLHGTLVNFKPCKKASAMC